jgi:hypothetical protein
MKTERAGKVFARDVWAAQAEAGPGASRPAGDPTEGGGPVLSREQVLLLYWGPAWNGQGGLSGQIDAAVRTILVSNIVLALNGNRCRHSRESADLYSSRRSGE